VRPLTGTVVATVDGGHHGPSRHWLARAGGWSRAHPRSVDRLLAFVLGVPLAALSLRVVAVSAPRPWPAVALGLAVVVAHVAIAFRRVTPLASFAVVCAAFALQTAASGLFLVLPSVVVFPLSLYAYCAYGRHPAPAVGLGAGVAGAGAVTVRFTLDQMVRAANIAPSPVLVFSLLGSVVLAAWSLGLFRRVQLGYVALLQERARRAEAEQQERARRAVLEERARIAREMHDVVAHSLSVMVSQAKGGRYAARADPGRAVTVLAAIEEAGRQALADMRGLLGVLRDDRSRDDGQRWGPQPTLRELPDLLDRVRVAGLPVGYREQGTAFPVGPAAELAVFRLVQEALTNSVKHAGPGAHAQVDLAWKSDRLTVTVSDDGCGPTATDADGHGLAGMRERLAAVGGSVSAGRGPDGGFLVRARLPYPHARATRSGHDDPEGAEEPGEGSR
jgi:signal transduction histidine kinase